ncbi:4Fe-4S binding protein [Pseudocitrobacter faecalis]
MISNALLKGVEPGERCVRRQFRYASCDACVRVCPTQALSCADGKLVVDNDHCVKCAACLFVCPVEAIEGVETEKRFSRSYPGCAFLRDCPNGRRAAFLACGKSYPRRRNGSAPPSAMDAGNRQA